MGFSDRILGKKSVNGGPHIESVSPELALAGGEIRIAGSGLRPQQWQRPHVQFGDVEGGIVHVLPLRGAPASPPRLRPGTH